MHRLFLASSSTLPHEIMELLDVRHRVLLHLLLEDAPPVLNTVQVWRHTWPLHHLHLQQQGSCHLGSVVWVVDMLENCFWREGIIFCFRMSQYMLESMFPSMNRSSLVPAVVMQPQTTMLPPPCMTVGKAQFSWYSSPGRRHTCWTPSEPNKFTLHSSDHRHGSSNSCSWSGCLQQTICRLFLWASFRRGFLLGQRPCKPTCCSVWRMVWAPTSWASTSATLKQCWQHSCICFWSQLLHLTHSTKTQLLWSTLVRPVPSENHFGKPLYDHGHSTVTQYQVVTELLISYAIFVESQGRGNRGCWGCCSTPCFFCGQL